MVGLNGSRSEWEGTWVHGSLRAGSHKRIATISSSRQPGSSSLDDSTTVYEVYEGKLAIEGYFVFGEYSLLHVKEHAHVLIGLPFGLLRSHPPLFVPSNGSRCTF